MANKEETGRGKEVDRMRKSMRMHVWDSKAKRGCVGGVKGEG